MHLFLCLLLLECQNSATSIHTTCGVSINASRKNCVVFDKLSIYFDKWWRCGRRRRRWWRRCQQNDVITAYNVGPDDVCHFHAAKSNITLFREIRNHFYSFYCHNHFVFWLCTRGLSVCVQSNLPHHRIQMGLSKRREKIHRKLKVIKFYCLCFFSRSLDLWALIAVFYSFILLNDFWSETDAFLPLTPPRLREASFVRQYVVKEKCFVFSHSPTAFACNVLVSHFLCVSSKINPPVNNNWEKMCNKIWINVIIIIVVHFNGRHTQFCVYAALLH